MKINFNLTESGHVGLNVTDLESSEARFAELREFFPNAKEEDWRVEVAGQRVHIIKKDPTYDGVLEFGTELVIASDHSIVAMLGASPSASTAVRIMLQVVERASQKVENIRMVGQAKGNHSFLRSISHRESGLVRAGARRRSSSIAHQHYQGDWANKEVGR
jgi:Malate:quinone oxidoreductase (Mqo)